MLPSGALSLPRRVSTQAIFFPSGEMAVCSNVCAAYNASMTLSSGDPGVGYAASLERVLTAGLSVSFCWANSWPELQIESVKMTATNQFEKRMTTDLSS